MKTNQIWIGCLLLGVLLFSGCALNPPSKVAAVADVATKIQSTANVILHAAVAANATVIPSTGKPLVSRQALDDVALAVNAIGRGGLTLKTALDDYNVAKAAGKDTSAQVAAVQKILADLNAALAQIGKAIPNGTVQAIDQAAVTILGLVAQVKAGL